MFNNLTQLAATMVDFRSALGVEAESLTTGEVAIDLFFGEDVVNKAYNMYPLSEWKVTFYSMVWARQTYIKDFALKYQDLEDQAADAELEFEEHPTSSHYERKADCAFEVAWRAGESLANLLAKWTKRNIMICRREIWSQTISYGKIRED